MSMWTYFHAHVITEKPIPENYFGKQFVFKKYPSYNSDISEDEFNKISKEIYKYNIGEWTKVCENPGDYLPHGSEGTLQYAWQNNKVTYTFRGEEKTGYSTQIMGSLRNFSKSDYLHEQFKGMTKKLNDYELLQAYVNAKSDLMGEFQWSYQANAMDEKYKLHRENPF